MALDFFMNWGKAGGRQAMRALQTELASRTPGISIEAGQIGQENKLDAAGDIIIRYRHDLEQAEAEYNSINGRYQQQMNTATVLQSDIEGYQKIIDSTDPAVTETQKATARQNVSDTTMSLNNLVGKCEKMTPDLDHAKEALDQARSDLADAEKAYAEHAEHVVSSVKDGEEARKELERANREKERAIQRSGDARKLAGLADDGTSSTNPALAAIRAAAQKTKDEAAALNLKTEALKKNSSHDEDDPIVKAAMARAAGTPAGGASVADRLAALQTRRAA